MILLNRVYVSRIVKNVWLWTKNWHWTEMQFSVGLGFARKQTEMERRETRSEFIDSEIHHISKLQFTWPKRWPPPDLDFVWKPRIPKWELWDSNLRHLKTPAKVIFKPISQFSTGFESVALLMMKISVPVPFAWGWVSPLDVALPSPETGFFKFF